jgi:hypothetical protein
MPVNGLDESRRVTGPALPSKLPDESRVSQLIVRGLGDMCSDGVP